MRLVVLLGSGASVSAGMPKVDDITKRVLSGDRVFRHSDRIFYLVDEIAAHHDVEPVQAVVTFLHELKLICDAYFAVHDPERVTNYEDLAYFARQIDDAIGFEYENPALAPLIEKLVGGAYPGRNLLELRDIASEAADYIEDVVCGLLGGPLNDLSYLAPISDAFADGGVEQLDLFTLNHDRVFPTWLREQRIAYSDGFEREHGTLQLWQDTYATPNRRLFNLHGSIDWYRYNLELDGWSGQITARVDSDPTSAHGPGGELLGYPAGGRPRLLTGTFNKILNYPSDVFADQHFRFHEALAAADRVLVIGYGFRDKAINSRLIAWAVRPGQRRMVVAHRDPYGAGAGARGAIAQKWDRWEKSGVLAFVPRHLEGTTWAEMREKLTP
ncbi:MAG: hypothetical protein QOH16_3862 [Gaiellaceae bacterium]|nr:hypothetical protein [Gaiellaceae bacterium]